MGVKMTFLAVLFPAHPEIHYMMNEPILESEIWHAGIFISNRITWIWKLQGFYDIGSFWCTWSATQHTQQDDYKTQ